MARSAKTATKPAREPAPARVRKNMDVDPVKLARARKLLGTPSDTATVDEALDLICFRHEHMAALEQLAAAGGLVDIRAEESARASGGPPAPAGGHAVRRQTGGKRAAARPRP